MDNKIKSVFGIIINDQSLEISYEIKNENSFPIFIQNLLFDANQNGNLIINRNKVYILNEPNDTVHLTKSTVKIPFGMAVEYPEIPFLSKVESGEIFKENIKIELPLKPNNPYDYTNYSETEIEYFNKIYFTISYLDTISDDLKFNKRSNCYTITPSLVSSLKVIKSDVEKISIPVYCKIKKSNVGRRVQFTLD